MDTLLGITAGDWWTLLRENRFAVDPPYWRRAAMLTILSLMNSSHRRKEDRLYGAAVAEVEIQAPLFIIGHWRTGTTLLHNLLALDEQFAYPNLFQISNPHTFLGREAAVAKQLADAPSQKRPMDNMEVAFNSPGEDEFATSMMSLRSPVIAWSFPRREGHYDRYLTFRGVPEEDSARWKAAFVLFLKKLIYLFLSIGFFQKLADWRGFSFDYLPIFDNNRADFRRVCVCMHLGLNLNFFAFPLHHRICAGK